MDIVPPAKWVWRDWLTPQKGNPHMPPIYGRHMGVIHGQKLQIQERWCVGCKSPSLKNDWLVPMFLSVCMSVSDQSPSTKVCKKQDCRNQVVQFLTNPFLAKFSKWTAFSPSIVLDLHIVTQRGTHVPPCIGGHMGL